MTLIFFALGQELLGAVLENGNAAFRELQRRHYDLVLSDLKMPECGGLELLELIRQAKLSVITIIMTGFGTVETAIEAMKKGAYDYILKPFKVEDVVRIVRRGLDRQRLLRENIELREALSIYKVSEAIAHSLHIDEILDLIVQATLDELDADMATLLLRRSDEELLTERIRKLNPRMSGTLVGEINLETVMHQLGTGNPLLAHGLRAMRFVARPPEEQNLSSFCSVPLKVQDRLVGVLNAYSYTRGTRFSEGQRRMLSVLASRAAAALENAHLYEDLVEKHEDLSRLNLSLEENFKATIIGFAHALEESDRYTRGHSERVSSYSRLIAEGLELPQREIDTVVKAGLMHDIGKIGIRYDKLNKAGKLTPEEMAMFRTHPAKGKRILEPIPFMSDLVPGAWCHHESWDGSGYPRGLMNDNIPLLGRLVAVADAYDAMTSDRAYRKAFPHETAVRELRRCAGSQFDAELVEVFVRKIDEHRAGELQEGRDVPR